MRKTSIQIWREINTEEALNNFEHRDELNEALDDLLNFRVNELDALCRCMELTKNNKFLNDYVADKIIDHAKNIMNTLGFTIDGFKSSIEEIEEQRRRYDKIRNSIITKLDS